MSKAPRRIFDRVAARRLGLGLLLGLLPIPSIAQQESALQGQEDQQSLQLVPIPTPDLGGLDPMVEEALKSRGESLKAAVAGGDARALVEAYGEIGFLYHAHGLWQPALVAYFNAGQLAPKDPRWAYASALAHREAGDAEKAAKAYELSLDIAVDNPAALVALAEIRLEQNQPEWAKALLRLALKVLPESPAVLAVLGQVALSQERWGQAVEYYERALAQQPAANRLHYPLGLAYRGLGDLDKAREHIGKRGEVGVRPPDHIRDAITERKTGERVMLLDGRRAFAAGRFDEAVELFEKAVLAAPDSVRAKVNLASAVAMAGQPDRAIQMYRDILSAEPDNDAVLFNLGSLLRQRGEIDAAIELLQKAAEANADDGEIRLELARCFYAKGEVEQASLFADEAMRKQPSNSDAQLFSTQLLVALGQWTKARERLEVAHRLMPENGLVAHSLARLLAAAGDPEVRNGEIAVGLAARVAEAAPTARHLETLALALGEASRCSEAAQVQARAIEVAGEGAEALRLQGDMTRYQSGPPCRPPLG